VRELEFDKSSPRLWLRTHDDSLRCDGSPPRKIHVFCAGRSEWVDAITGDLIAVKPGKGTPRRRDFPNFGGPSNRMAG
jgi:hypothetical protein